MLAATLYAGDHQTRIDADKARASTLLDIARAMPGGLATVRLSNGVTVTADTHGFTVRNRDGERRFTPAATGTIARLSRAHVAATRESEPENRDSER